MIIIKFYGYLTITIKPQNAKEVFIFQLYFLCFSPSLFLSGQEDKPNILFISVDDLKPRLEVLEMNLRSLQILTNFREARYFLIIKHNLPFVLHPVLVFDGIKTR
ncbi:MAG: hypothetical protein CM15mP121_2250 [Bacteroidota bacterium]|nr:MAG: hypothetical protein CM15mP121_2250 [Bacteroidota bacterium]